MSSKDVILFDVSKNERFQLTDNYKLFHRKVKSNWKVEQNDAELKLENIKHAKIFVIPGPQDRFTEDEFKALKEFVRSGGSLFLMLGEGGETEYNTNVNFFLEQYGIYINSDNVIRPHYYKNFHPKEATVGGGIVCEAMSRKLLTQDIETIDFAFSNEKQKIHFQYPYGATLSVTEPANILMTTGTAVYPFNRPLAGFYGDEQGGKILAIGSGYMFHDKFVSDKTNDAILDYFLHLLGTTEIVFNHLDFNDIEINDNKMFTDVGFVANLAKTSLVDSIGCNRSIPADFKDMFSMKLCRLSNRLLMDVIDTYAQLNILYEPLKIIKPQFEIPFPPLQLATFAPIFSEPPTPPLELYDLDDVFSPPQNRLAATTNKLLQAMKASDPQKLIKEKELEAYIKECARIVGILGEGQDMPAIDIINTVVEKVSKLNAEA